eukprot:CAMPEP_0170512554 /NCGR_PEP_ID=MMETSP0208-20121228/66914_1 /TAXON_ID=197538 /ORGANISM="Strombidium inclinatum, Strain S3" /LENGTH=103 /DNA_ID=CAMNT_0010796197 /DNA_START=771 /DNA_END=1082 /DNA_ORIENTATION=-
MEVDLGEDRGSPTAEWSDNSEDDMTYDDQPRLRKPRSKLEETRSDRYMAPHFGTINRRTMLSSVAEKVPKKPEIPVNPNVLNRRDGSGQVTVADFLADVQLIQ